MNLRIITPVWGFDYIDLFLRYSLSSLMAERSELDPYIAAWRIELHIYTTASSLPWLQQSNRLQALVETCRLDLHLHVIATGTNSKYTAMTWAHQHAINAVTAPDQALFFSNPDVIYAEGTLKKTLQLAAGGKKAVMVLGLRANKESLLSEIVAGTFGADNLQLLRRIPKRQLVTLCLKHLHPLSRAHIVADNKNLSLGHYYWPIGSNALLARCFHIHPLFLWPDDRGQKIVTTIDHELVRWSVTDSNNVHVVQDSDELFLCEISSGEHLNYMISNAPISVEAFVDWAAEWTNELHRNFARTSIVFRGESGDVPPEIEREATGLIHSYLSALATYFKGQIPRDMQVIRRSLQPEKTQGFPPLRSAKSLAFALARTCGTSLTSVITRETWAKRKELSVNLQRLDSTIIRLARTRPK